MKNQQHEAARELYFNSNLSKTEIGERLDISRRTIYQWSVDGDWDKLRQSARHMPAILAEKCSYLIGHLMDHLLGANTSDMAITKQEVDMLHKLTVTLNKLKRGTTIADNMETFTYFLERMRRADPELAAKVAPHAEDYITARRSKSEHDFLLDGFDETGHLPYSENNNEEARLDQEEAAAILAELQQPEPAATHSRSHSHSTTTPPSKSKPNPTTPPHSQPHSNSRQHEPIRMVHTPLHTITQKRSPASAAAA